MKQIDIIKAYGQKRCLVVEVNPDMRADLKRNLVDFGSTNVDTAGHASEAIDLCQRHQYDIVLADYDLGKGQTGQQLLEELRFQGLLKNTAIFFMISSEMAVQHVVYAIEYQPDDYVSKPINRENLRPRLDAALMRNEALKDVKKALDQRRPRSAIAACQDVVHEGGKFQNDAKKLLGELLCQQGMYDEAILLFDAMPANSRPLWAGVGLAKALIGLKELDKAEAVLKNIIAENEYCVEAHDTLSKVYQAKNKFDQAQQALITAVNISPISANRQREMGRVCLASGDKNAAAHAYRAAIKYSKNSCQESSEDFTNLAGTLSDLIIEQKNPELATEAFEAVQYADKKYGRQPVVQMRLQLVNADIYEHIGDEENADKANRKALEVFSELNFSVVENTSTQLCIDCAKAFMARGKYDEGERLLQEVAKLNNNNDLAIQIDKLLREPLTKEGIAFAAKLNKQGIGFHKQNKFDDAIRSFQNVLQELPNHIGLNLNLIQTLLTKSKETTLKEKELKLMESCFQRVGALRESSPYQERFDYLEKRFNRLKS
ncbi:MAG: response regulator [Agarilytica sp.]